MSFDDQNGVSGKPSHLVSLSFEITRNASILDQHFNENNLPQPSFNRDGPSVVVPKDSPQNIIQAQQELIAAALEISQLAIGPSEFLPNLALGYQYISCMTWLCEFGIFHLVPLHDSITYLDLAKAARVPEQRLRSMIRMAMTNTMFQEECNGTRVVHSATSAFLVQNPGVYAYATYILTKSAPMAMHLASAHRRWGPDTTHTYETAYNAAFNTDLPFFECLGRDKKRMDEFAAHMRHVQSSDGVDMRHLVSGFNWEGVQEGGRVVDVGGSTGSAAIALARKFPHLSFIVQDLPVNAENGQKALTSLPDEIRSRIIFQSHDFTKPQPVRAADIYLLRMILHDWSDAEAITIIRNIVAKMDPAVSRLLIMDTVLPKPASVPLSVERLARARDLVMLQAFNSKERHLEDWKELFQSVDPSLELRHIIQPCGSVMSVMEIGLGSVAP